MTSDAYDLNGQQVTLTRPDGKTLTAVVNAAGQVTQTTDPDRGTTTATYDQDSNVLSTTDARGAVGTTYTGYDGLNRPLWRNSASASPTGAYVTYSYDATAGGNDGIGRLTGETFANANVGGALSGAYS